MNLINKIKIKNSNHIGLALGGGAVLGAAHIGVLKALDEFDIKINYISGTSIGALVASLFAFGKNWKEIEEIALDLNWLDISKISLSKYALLSNEKLGDLLSSIIGDTNIEEANIPLAMIATNITNGEKKILSKGSTIKAVMASTCIPGIFQPVEIDNLSLIDGGIVENLPIKTVKEMGSSYIIAVDLNSKQKFDKPKNILDVLLNSFQFIMKQSDKLHIEDADLLIKPDLSEFSSSDTSQIKELINKGYLESKKVLEKML